MVIGLHWGSKMLQSDGNRAASGVKNVAVRTVVL